ncbi:putative zinc metalloprotease TRE2 [Nakaseomyces bracarensis]|uniref:Zinc metalloprotease TRE2 n=1 Tax=Nakaseomyces bracarensis TaxID=273131 RepID=A0ABR4NVR7_9SACH
MLSLPSDPPSYDEEVVMETSYMEPMLMDDIEGERDENETGATYFTRIKTQLNDNVIMPVQEKIIDPLAGFIYLCSDTIDFYLSMVGNPFILSRFIYIFMVSLVVYYVMVRGAKSDEDQVSGMRGSFTDHAVFLQYARLSADLAKFERDLEYLSSMPHMSGTKGDTAMRQYVYQSMKNNNIKLLRDWEIQGFASYPNADKNRLVVKPQDGHQFSIDLGRDNFSPVSPNGEIRDSSLIYGSLGSEKDLRKLQEEGILKDNFILLLKYDKFVGQQMLLAQKYGAKGVLFLSEEIMGNEDTVLQKSVAITPYGAGVLQMRYPNLRYDENFEVYSDAMPNIPAMPLSKKQGNRLLSLLKNKGIKLDEKNYSGETGSVQIYFKLDNIIRTAQSFSDFVGKIEGKEQTNKAIVIAAKRNSINNGATSSAFGTSMMLSLIQLFQEMKYRFNWKPLRNIYFISFGGSDYNFEGSHTLVEQKLGALKDEVYAMIDISEIGVNLEDLNKLDIQSHPLMYDFFKSIANGLDIDAKVKPVQDYGDWTPYLTNGIPVAVMSRDYEYSKEFVDTKFDTFDKVRDYMNQNNNQEKILNLLLYLFDSVLKLVDEPMIPFNIPTLIVELDRMLKDLEQSYKKELRFDKVIEFLLHWKRLGQETADWKEKWARIVDNRNGLEPTLYSNNRWNWNKLVSSIGRWMCAPEGLTSRPNYKNILFGPTLYADNKNLHNWNFPGVRDAIYKEDFEGAQEELNNVALVLKHAASIYTKENYGLGDYI